MKCEDVEVCKGVYNVMMYEDVEMCEGCECVRAWRCEVSMKFT